MAKIERFNGTRWMQIRNDGSTPLFHVEANLAVRGGLNQRWLVAKTLSPGKTAYVPMVAKGLRVKGMRVSAAKSENGQVVHSQKHAGPSNAYYRWVHLGINEAGLLGGFARAQSVTGRAYEPEVFSYGSVAGDPDTASDEAGESVNRSDDANGNPPATTQWLEIVNRTGKPIELVSVALATEDLPLTVDIKLPLQSDEFIDIDLTSDAVRAGKCKVNFRIGGAEHIETVDLQLKWLLWGALFIYADDLLPVGFAGFDGSDHRMVTNLKQPALTTDSN